MACAENADEVEIYESGVGAINLPLMHGMATGARTTRSSHPRFLRLMAELVSRVAGRSVQYVLPHRHQTKAEVVRTLADDALADLVNETNSCVHYLVPRGSTHCGWCPACIGRRQAMISAGIAEPDTQYAYDLFGKPEETNSIELGKLKYLKAFVMQVDRLADLDGLFMPEWFRRYAIGTGVAHSDLGLRPWVDVLLRYRDEWLELISRGRSRGWNWARWLPMSAVA